MFTGDTLFKDSVGGVKAPGPHDLHGPARLDHGHADGAPARDRHPSRPRRRHDRRARVGGERLHPRLARPRPGGLRAVHRARRARHADPARRRLRRRHEGLGALARRRRRHRSRAPKSSAAAEREPLAAGRAPPRIAADGATRTRRSRPRACGARRRSRRSPPARPSSSSARARPTSRATRTPPSEAMSRRQLETAKQIVAVLGTMKGAAMKLGQVMSFLDVGPRPRGAPRGVPARAREAARRRADGLLQADAPGDRGGPRRGRSTRSSRVRRGADRRGLDRAGLPRAARRATAARWPSRCSTPASPAPCAPTCRTWT